MDFAGLDQAPDVDTAYDRNTADLYKRYAKMTPYAPSTCDQLNTDPGCTQPLWKDFSGDSQNGAKNFYVS